jgi:hypothetical protein
MDLLSLLTGSENLYKYLFVAGIGMIVLALFYPLDKEYDLACKRDTYNKEINLLNYEIEKLKDSAAKVEKDYSSLVDKYNQSKTKIEKVALKENFDLRYKGLLDSRKNIEVKQINLDYDKQAILTLQAHINDYEKYEWWFYIFGSLFTIGGTVGWFLLMKKAKIP